MNEFHVSVGGLGVLAKIERLLDEHLHSADIYADASAAHNEEGLGAEDETFVQESSRPATAGEVPSRPDTAGGSSFSGVDDIDLIDTSVVSHRLGTSKSAKRKDKFIETISEEVVAAKLKNSETTNIAAFGSCGLELVPLTIFDYPNIRQLYLEKNFLQVVPSQILNLNNLGVVRLFSNNLCSVPPELFDAPITALWLHDNLLVSLPEEIGNAKKLVTLTLHDNPFEFMPTAMGRCLKLKKITLPECCTTPAQALIRQGEAKVILYFQKLIKAMSTKVVELSSFRLPTVNREIDSLTMLTGLEFSMNLLTTLPWSIGFLTNVTELDLSKNKLQELPESMSLMCMMRKVDISHNPRILALPAAFGAMFLLENLMTLGCDSLILPPPHVINGPWAHTKRMLYDVFKGCRDETFSAIEGYHLDSSDWLSILWKSFDTLSSVRCCNGLKNLSISTNSIAALHVDLFRISSLATLLVDRNLIETIPDLGTTSNLFFQQLEWLDIGFNNLQEIPDLLQNATNLVSLGIGGINLGGIKAFVCNLMPGLTRLDISFNRIKKVPEDFRNMKSLIYLNIERNTFPTIPDEVYVMTKLQSLLLAGNPIECIPKWAPALSNLTQVSLADTKLSEIPREWFCLKDLMWMSFTGAPIAANIEGDDEVLWAIAIRAAIGAAAGNAGFVRLMGHPPNILTSLPMGLRFHTSITDMDVSYNQIRRFSSEIGGLIKMKRLNASNNMLHFIDPAIGFCTSLEMLNLCQNPLKELPADLGMITCMQDLHIHDLNLTFPAADIISRGTLHIMRFLLGYSRFNRCGILNLSGMGLSRIPNDVFLITNLKGLSLDKNPVPFLSEELIQMTLLELLSLDFTGLQDYRIFNEKWPIARWPLLQNLRIRGIFSSNFDLIGVFRITALTKLAISKNAISDIPQQMSALVNLMKLDLSHNVITYIPIWFSNLRNLNEVDLRSNRLIKMHPAFGASNTLRRLYVDDNPNLMDPPKSLSSNFGFLGKYVRGIFQGWATAKLVLNDLGIDVFQPMLHLLSHIQVLDLSRNILQLIPESFSDLQSLKKLVLDHNRLLTLPNVFDKLTALEVLSVDHNPLISLPFSVGGAVSLQLISCNFMPRLISPPFEVASKSSALVIIYMEKLFSVQSGTAIKLDLSGYGMRRWPAETSFLPKLVKLIVNNNKISSIIEKVTLLTNLQVLHLKDNQIQALPSFILSMQCLTDLDVSLNGIPEVPAVPESSLKIFKASGNSISMLPETMNLWTNLTDLRIGRNIFEIIPEPIFVLSSLMHLDIGGNVFRSLPSELFECLPELLTFHCSNSNLSDIPYSIGGCSKLTDIRLDQNSFREVPYSVGNCENLRVITADWHIVLNPPQEIISRGISRINEYLSAIYKGSLSLDLNVSNYCLLSVPNMSGSLINLQRADFSCNAIKQVPPAIGRLRSLVWLSFHSNMLSRLPTTFAELSGLTHMDLSTNKFESLPEYFCTFTNLVELDLSANLLHDIPVNFVQRLSSLESLKASHNMLHEVPLCISELPGIHTLCFHENPILYIPGEFEKLKKLKHLTFSLAKLECMQTWRRNPVLDYAPIAGHQIEVPPSEVLICGSRSLYEFLRNVATSRRSKKSQLNLSKASFWVSQCLRPTQTFEFFPDCLLKLHHLKALNLHGNDIRVIPSDISMMTSLMSLNIGGNRLSELPDSFSCLVHLDDLIVLPNVFLASPDRVVILQGSRALVSFYKGMASANSGRKIIMSDLQLPRIPNEVMMIQNLLFLDLSRNSLTVFPAEIRAMTCLTHLNLEYNFITYIPSFLINHVGLTWLDISNNWIIVISPLLEQHWNTMPMKWLDLTGNLFPEVPILQNADISEKDQILRFYFSFMKSWTSGTLNLDSFDLEFMPAETFNSGNFPRMTMKQLGMLLQEALLDDILTQHSGNEKSINQWLPQRVADLEEDVKRSIARDQNAQRRHRHDRITNIMADVQQVVHPFRQLYRNLLTQLETYGNPKASHIPLGPAMESPNVFLFFSHGRFSGLTSLNLSKNKIQNIEPATSNLLQLTNLNLSDNNLIMIPPNLRTLSKLTSLNISCNKIAVIPNALSTLSELISLDTSHNELIRFDEAMSRWTRLTKLNVSFNRLVVIDDLPCMLTNLTSFFCEDNQIATVSPRIGLLKSLGKLNFGGNPLTSVPPDIGLCENLVDACFNRCGLARLPMAMKTLLHLRRLIFTDNKLVLIPQFLNTLHFLSELRVDVNQIVYASKEFCFCQSLEILHFQDNGLQVLPRAMDRMTVLKVLRLDHNCLESLVGGIGMLQSCQSMDLSHNRLSELPAFPALYSLTSLALSNNKITQFPDSLTELSSLLMLDLSYNSIIVIPSFTALLKKLTFFDLSHNRIDDLHPKLWKLSDLEVLKLDHNNMGGVRPENVELGNMLAMMGQKAPALNYQTITDNVSKLVNLRTFTLSNNSLQNLPSSLGTMTSLTELWIQNNPLSSIPDSLSNLRNLSIFTVDSGVPGVASLRQLVLFDEPDQ